VTARLLLVHLRLPFQLLLAPVWLWGCLVAGGGWSASAALGFVAFHAFLYSGVTAFNSYYDRDVGPVGGLEHPPEVPEALLWFSLLIQGIGLLLCAFVNLSVVLAYCAFVLLSVAYSHPRLRLKAHTYGSLVVVALGQGVLAFSAAWAAVRGGVDGLLGATGVLGALSSALLILALYPLTQLFQIDEDAARGDRTLAVAWGPRACCYFALTCTALGGVMMVWTVALLFGKLDATLLSLGLLLQLGLIAWLTTTLQRDDTRSRYRRVMRLARLSASGLSAYLLARLILSWRA
jgi:1,4-dihydroxy-2-naphthoate octaprenyltransferase